MSTFVDVLKGRVSLTDEAKLLFETIVNSALHRVVREELQPLRDSVSALRVEVDIGLSGVRSKLTDMSVGVEEVKDTDFYGKRSVILPSALESVRKMTNGDIRVLIHRAAKAHQKGKRFGYNHIYTQLRAVTGVDVYTIGATRLGKKDRIEGWSKDPSYLNTILKEGIQYEAAVIASDMLSKR